MKRLILSLLLILGAIPSFAVSVPIEHRVLGEVDSHVYYTEGVDHILPQYVSTVHNNGILQLNPGWQFVQDWVDPTSPSGTTFNLNSIVTTTAGSVWIVYWGGGNSGSGAAITMTVSGGGGTWTTCTGCANYLSANGLNQRVAYNLSGTAGTSSLSITFSATPNIGSIEFAELLPPAGYTASFDGSGANQNLTCTTPSCPGAALSQVTASDAILQFPVFGGGAVGNFPWSGGTGYNYTTDIAGNAMCLNCTAATAPTAAVDGTGSAALVTAIAFKSTAGSFTTASPVFSFVNINTSYGSGQVPNYNCNPTCAYTLGSTTSGNLLFMQTAALISGYYISSVSGGGTWVVPSGCQIHDPTTYVSSMSCAYVLSATGGTTSITITMNGSNSGVGIIVYEIHRSTGTWSLDAINASQNTASFYPPGQALSLSGNLDVLFQAFLDQGAVSACTYYPFFWTPGGGGQYGNEFLWQNATSFALLNARQDITPTCYNPQNNTSIVHGVAFK